MVHASLSCVDNAPSFATHAMADSVADEMAIANDRRDSLEAAAADFDPCGLYAREISRDAASEVLANAFPGVDVTLSMDINHHRINGKWVTSERWFALAHLDEPASAYGDSAAAAVQGAIEAHAAATLPVRSTPLYAPLEAGKESFGIIDPAASDAFLALVGERMGTADFLAVDRAGRVLLNSGNVSGGEARAIGDAIAEFNLTDAARAGESAIQTVIEPRDGGEFFAGFIVLASGERIPAPGVFTTHAHATDAATRLILDRRSTIDAPAVAVTSDAHAA